MLFVPPFGEEMNKSRRQFTVTMQALLDEGIAVLLPDLFGTGDSDGNFSQATWECWKADIVAAMSWIDSHALVLESTVATRLGCALVAESLKMAGRSVGRTVFWQPVDSGHQFVTQFLRLRVAASMMESNNKETVESLRQRLSEGETLEIAGYSLSPALWRDIEEIVLSQSLDPCLGKLALIEVGSARDGQLSPVGRCLLATANEKGMQTTGMRLAGDPFWNATEIVTNPELAMRTVQFLTEGQFG